MRNAFNEIIARIKGMTNVPFDVKAQENLAHIIVSISRLLNYDFCAFEGDAVYIYVKTHWQRIPGYELKVFLKECLCSMLGDIKGSKRKDVDDLVKQFPYTTMSLNAQPAKNKINFLNGTLDLRAGSFTQHYPNDFLRYVLPYYYNPQADCPMFMKYLNRVLPDREVQNVLAEYVAWLFSDLKLEKVLFLYGSGCNGKSVFVDIVEALVGKENVCHESITDMCGENGANHRSNIIGKLLNTCSDVSPSAFQGDVFKRLASGEPISSKILYQDVTSTTDYAKMIFCLNELPRTNDYSTGYFRRMLIVPFKVQIHKKEIDPNLAKKITATELPGIMNWVLQGYGRLITNQAFSPSKALDREIENYRNGNRTANKSLIILPPGFQAD